MGYMELDYLTGVYVSKNGYRGLCTFGSRFRIGNKDVYRCVIYLDYLFIFILILILIHVRVLLLIVELHRGVAFRLHRMEA